MVIYPLDELLPFVRSRSPYYRELYAALPPDEVRLEALPVVSHQALWAANSMTGGDNRVLTGPLTDGVVFKSGGTTGAPKLSVYLQQEWEMLCATFGAGLVAGGLSAGERVGNLFYVGDLYASFVFIQRALELAPVPVVQFPISGSAPPESIVRTIFDLGITTLIGTTTTLVAVVEQVAAEAARSARAPQLRKLLFGGEALYPDQRARLLDLFPALEILSNGCASVDAGLLGYADPSCGPQEHRGFGAATRIEILEDDRDTPITEVGRSGRLVVTNLIRRLMPILRYPSGDRAEWVEPAGESPDRKFRLLGRSEEGARVGPITVYYDDVRDILAPFLQPLGILGYQLHIAHDDRKDRLRIRIAVRDPRRVTASSSAEVLAELHAQRPMLRGGEAQGIVHATGLDWMHEGELAVNPRTGKLRRVIDERW
jgi:phenylacetate-CoA ligase